MLNIKKKCSNPATAAAENFEATVRLWGAMESSEIKEDRDSLFVSTGVSIPDQNYACAISGYNAQNTVRSSVRFFEKQRVPFTWWIPPGIDGENLKDALKKEGLTEACSPPAMEIYLSDDYSKKRAIDSSYAIQHAKTPHEAEMWGRCSLAGFESGTEHEEPFLAFSRAMTVYPFSHFFRMLTLITEGAPAATSLISVTEEIGGIYYFSTTPALRRKGIGLILLNATLAEAQRSGCRTVTLQASEMGFPLYKSAGFKQCGHFNVYSSSCDVF